MKTTSFLAELLVVGVFSIPWIYPFLIFGLSLNKLENTILSEPIGLIIFLSIIYTLGILINFLADLVFIKIDDLIVKKYGGKNKISEVRTKILFISKEATDYMMQRRSFVRIFRANSLNIFLFLVIFFFNVGQINELMHVSYFGMILLLIILFVFVLWGYIRSLKGYFSFIKKTEELNYGR